MFCRMRALVLLSFLLPVYSLRLAAQEDSKWRIEPENINIQMGEDRPLQLLDDSAQELHDAIWSVDNPDLAEIQEQDGRAVLHSTGIGTVVVTASWGGEMRSREIRILPADQAPKGGPRWSDHDFRATSRGELPAVPTSDAPHLYLLEEFPDGKTRLRAISDDGIQIWTWLLPETNHDVELICGDWLGGALIGTKHNGSYTLYAVGKNGEMRWQHTLMGTRKGVAINTDNLTYIVTQSLDQKLATLLVLDDLTGAQKFELAVPLSREKLTNLRRAGIRFFCANTSTSTPMPFMVSRVFINMDGYAYLAFSQRDWSIAPASCVPGRELDPKELVADHDDKIVLWKIDGKGSYSTIIVDEINARQLLSAPLDLVIPTDALVTDNMNGVLIPVRVVHGSNSVGFANSKDEFVYRVNQDGELLYKFLLPQYAGSLKDEMVIGENDVAFATRGNFLIAFNLVSGKELWRWESSESDISVFAALANGHCLVQTPTALVEVAGSDEAKLILRGQAMLDWQGQLYRKKD